ncbi:MAG: SDR family oxidoreductase [Armatimonadetes bacterium]|nr:SDR family oxidoreductase [Armatimonadota bacterium]
MPTALVAGGAGFLGSHLVDKLIDEGWRVLAIDNLITGDWSNLDHQPDVVRIEADVSRPLTIDEAIDGVFHLASPASPVDFARIPFEILHAGSIATERLLELAIAKNARFLFASTSEVYGDPLVHPQSETYWGNVNPIGVRAVYDEAKRFGEATTMAFARYRSADVRIVRIFNTYGERMRLGDGRVVPNFVGQALRGEPLTVYGDGLQTRSFCYAKDLIDGIYRLFQSGCAEPVNIGNPTEHTILEFAKAVQRLTGSQSPIVHREFVTPDDPKQRRPDIAKAKSILGWEPATSLDDGLKRTIEDFQKRISRAQP